MQTELKEQKGHRQGKAHRAETGEVPKDKSLQLTLPLEGRPVEGAPGDPQQPCSPNPPTTTKSQAQMPNCSQLNNTAHQKTRARWTCSRKKTIMTTVGVWLVGAHGKGHVHIGKCKPRQKKVSSSWGHRWGSSGEPGHWDLSEENRAELSGTFDSTWQDNA